jgi:protein-S-isoprenylcysteine O-methyltransferase Ste14
MKNTNSLLGKILYALLFLIVVPMVLWYWAKFSEHLIQYPIIDSPEAGWTLTIIGGGLILWGMFALRKFGNGLPMNAFPPEKFVTQGPFRLFRHPIYWGFGILIFGVFILEKSAAGLWLVTPVTILSMIALVWGYEKIDLEKRFPNARLKTIFDFADNATESPTLRDRVSSLILIFITLFFGNYILEKLTIGSAAYFGKPFAIPSFFEYFYLSYLSLSFIGLVPFFLKRKDLIRDWTLSGILAVSLSVFFGLIYPSLFAQYPPSETRANLPFNETIFTSIPLFMLLISMKAYLKNHKTSGMVFTLIGILLGITLLTTSAALVEHFLSSLIIYFLAAYRTRVWNFLKYSSEKIANSWKEWTFGKVRVINHGFYVGFGSFFGILLAGILAGPSYAWAILFFALIVIIFSALWAQLIEGSEKLKRPYGYYGALVGIIFASLAVWGMGFNVWIIIGAISVVMPWVQAIGRLRCLINGCCHGGKVENPKLGIRYFHHRSRVCGISGLKGELLHPTPLYAIVWLFFVGFILLALWNNQLPNAFIFGLYLILTGIGRFVEEAYRGEVQTPFVKGLRLYQWTAIASVVIGIVMTIVPSNLPVVSPSFSGEIIAAALAGGLFTTFAMGVDFPYSNARFSRLV